jgi:hypothetical protein
MSLSNAMEDYLVNLIFQGTTIPGIADNTASSPNTLLYLSLHTADPGEAGNQGTSEVTYGSYARKSVARTSAGFANSSGGITSLVANQSFPAGTSGSQTATHLGIGTGASGATLLLMSGALAVSIPVGNVITPTATTATTFGFD